MHHYETVDNKGLVLYNHNLEISEGKKHDAIIKLYYNTLRLKILISISKGAKKLKLINDYISSMIHWGN